MGNRRIVLGAGPRPIRVYRTIPFSRPSISLPLKARHDRPTFSTLGLVSYNTRL